MITIRVSADVAKATNFLRQAERRHIPFATALALTSVAKHAQQAVTAELPSIFSSKGSPTPFTMRAIAFTPASKVSLTADVHVRPLQARYLSLEESGGFRTPAQGNFLPAPVAIQTNAFHNIPRNKIAQLASKPGYFIGTVKGVRGLYQKPKDRAAGTMTLLARFVPGWKISAKFHFADRVRADVARTLPGALKAAIDRALNTAR